MRRALLLLAEAQVLCDVPVEPWEFYKGLEGRIGLTDNEGMYFPSNSVIVMGAVSFPIDIVFCRDWRVSRIIESVQPGDEFPYAETLASGVLEVRGGWAQDHGLQIGTPLRWAWP